MGEGVSTDFKSSNRIELSWLVQVLLNFYWFLLISVNNFQIFSVLTWPHPSTHPPTHPSNYTPTHEWGILHRFQIFKRNWNILISSSAIEFWLIPGVPPFGGVGWVDRGGTLSGCLRVPHAHVHVHAHAHTCAHERWCHKGIPQDFPMGAAICMKLSCLYMYACVRVCMRAHAHMHGAPPKHPDRVPFLSTHPHPPKRRGPPESVKIQ